MAYLTMFVVEIVVVGVRTRKKKNAWRRVVKRKMRKKNKWS